MATVRILPPDVTLEIPEGAGLRDALRKAGILLDYPCGGAGKCGQCRVLVDPPPASGKGGLGEAETGAGWRLACAIAVEGDCTVRVPEERVSRLAWIREAGDGDLHLPPDAPRLKRAALRMAAPALGDQTADWERLRAALEAQGACASAPDAAGLSDLSAALRESEWSADAVLDGADFVWLAPGGGLHAFGFAADLGTTTVDVALVDLEDGRVADRTTLLNRQVSFGADVISRAQAYHADPDPVRKAAVDSLGEAAEILLDRTGVRVSQVLRTVVAGNPIMLHILNGIDPLQLTVAPFAPVVSGTMSRTPRDLGIGFQRHGRISCLPLVSAYVGADTVGMILSLGLDSADGTALAIDIGTNGEIVLARGGSLMAASTAAGPAFEGAEIRCGMRALAGAVYGVYMPEDGEPVLRTVGDARPRGICGTGLVSAVAEMLARGLILPTGRLAEPGEARKADLKKRLAVLGGERAFVLSRDPDVYIAQSDIRKLQLAKGAVRTGIDTLLDRAGLSVDSLDAVYLAGNFGAGLDCASAARIGLIPPVAPVKVRSVGNAALRGAVLALLSGAYGQRAEKAARRAVFVELGADAAFQSRFADSMMF